MPGASKNACTGFIDVSLIEPLASELDADYYFSGPSHLWSIFIMTCQHGRPSITDAFTFFGPRQERQKPAAPEKYSI
jgi:hypothetical protein